MAAVPVTDFLVSALGCNGFQGEHRVGVIKAFDDAVIGDVLTAVESDAEGFRGIVEVLQDVHVVGHGDRLGAVGGNKIVPGSPGAPV